jgi:ribosomal-protein-alanine N-acetyltransferase
MESTFSLRPATTEDLARVLQIEKQVHVAPWVEDHFCAELTKPYSHFLLLTDDETDADIIGYIVFWMMFDECQILNVVVDLPHRGQGFAKQMIRKAALIAAKNDISKIVLDVRKSNTPAIQLYQSLNFAITNVRKSFYGNGEDAYHMILSLKEDQIQF